MATNTNTNTGDLRVGAEVNDPTYGLGRVVRLVAFGTAISSVVVVFYQGSKEYEFSQGGLFDLKRLELTATADALAKTAGTITQNVQDLLDGGTAPVQAGSRETTSWHQVISGLQGQQYRDNGNMYKEVQRRLQAAQMRYEGTKTFPRLEAISTADDLMDVLCPLCKEPWAMDIMMKELYNKKKLPTGIQITDRPGSSVINNQIYGTAQDACGRNTARRSETIKLQEICKTPSCRMGRTPDVPNAFKPTRIGKPPIIETRSVALPGGNEAKSWDEVIVKMRRNAKNTATRGNVAYGAEVTEMANWLEQNKHILPPLQSNTEEIYAEIARLRGGSQFGAQRAKYSRAFDTMQETGLGTMKYSLPERHRLEAESPDPAHRFMSRDKIPDPTTVGDALYLMAHKQRPVMDAAGNQMLDDKGQLRFAIDPRSRTVAERLAAVLPLDKPISNYHDLAPLIAPHADSLAGLEPFLVLRDSFPFRKEREELPSMRRGSYNLFRHLEENQEVYADLRQKFVAASGSSWETIRGELGRHEHETGPSFFDVMYQRAGAQGMPVAERNLLVKFVRIEDVAKGSMHMGDTPDNPALNVVLHGQLGIAPDANYAHGTVSIFDLSRFFDKKFRPSWKALHPTKPVPEEHLSQKTMSLSPDFDSNDDSDYDNNAEMDYQKLFEKATTEDLEAHKYFTDHYGDGGWDDDLAPSSGVSILNAAFKKSKETQDILDLLEEEHSDRLDQIESENQDVSNFAGARKQIENLKNREFADKMLSEELENIGSRDTGHLFNNTTPTASTFTLLGVRGNVGDPIHGLYDPYIHFAGLAAEGKLDKESVFISQFANLQTIHNDLINTTEEARKRLTLSNEQLALEVTQKPPEWWQGRFEQIQTAVQARKSGQTPDWWMVAQKLAAEEQPEYRLVHNSKQMQAQVLYARRRAQQQMQDAPGFALANSNAVVTAKVGKITEFHINEDFFNGLPDELNNLLEMSGQRKQPEVLRHNEEVTIGNTTITPDMLLHEIGIRNGEVTEVDVEAGVSLFSQAKNLTNFIAPLLPKDVQQFKIKQAVASAYYEQASEGAAIIIAKAVKSGRSGGDGLLKELGAELRERLATPQVRGRIAADAAGMHYIDVDAMRRERPEQHGISFESLDAELNEDDERSLYDTTASRELGPSEQYLESSQYELDEEQHGLEADEIKIEKLRAMLGLPSIGEDRKGITSARPPIPGNMDDLLTGVRSKNWVKQQSGTFAKATQERLHAAKVAVVKAGHTIDTLKVQQGKVVEHRNKLQAIHDALTSGKTPQELPTAYKTFLEDLDIMQKGHTREQLAKTVGEALNEYREYVVGLKLNDKLDNANYALWEAIKAHKAILDETTAAVRKALEKFATQELHATEEKYTASQLYASQLFREISQASTTEKPSKIAQLEHELLVDPDLLTAVQGRRMTAALLTGINLEGVADTLEIAGPGRSVSGTAMLQGKAPLVNGAINYDGSLVNASLTGEVPGVTKGIAYKLQGGATERVLSNITPGPVIHAGTIAIQDGHVTFLDSAGKGTGQESSERLTAWLDHGETAALFDLEYFHGVPYQVGYGTYNKKTNELVTHDTFLQVDSDTAIHMRRAVLEHSPDYATGEVDILKTGLRSVMAHLGIKGFTHENYATAINYLEETVMTAQTQGRQRLPDFVKETLLPLAHSADIVMNQNIIGADLPVIERTLRNNKDMALADSLASISPKIVDIMAVTYHQRGLLVGLNKFLKSDQGHTGGGDIRAIITEQLPVIQEMLDTSKTTPGIVHDPKNLFMVDHSTGLIYQPEGEMSWAHYFDGAGKYIDTRASQHFARVGSDTPAQEVVRNYEHIRIEQPTEVNLASRIDQRFSRHATLEEAQDSQQLIFHDRAMRRLRLNTSRKGPNTSDDLSYLLSDELVGKHLDTISEQIKAKNLTSQEAKHELATEYINNLELQRINSFSAQREEHFQNVMNGFEQNIATFKQSFEEEKPLQLELAALRESTGENLVGLEALEKQRGRGSREEQAAVDDAITRIHDARNSKALTTGESYTAHEARLLYGKGEAQGIHGLEERRTKIAEIHGMTTDQYQSMSQEYESATDKASYKQQVTDGIRNKEVEAEEFGTIQSRALAKLRTAIDPRSMEMSEYNPASGTQQQLMYMHEHFFTNEHSIWGATKDLASELQRRNNLEITDDQFVSRTVANDTLSNFLRKAMEDGLLAKTQHAGATRTRTEQHAELAISLGLNTHAAPYKLTKLDITSADTLARDVESHVFRANELHRTGVEEMHRHVLKGMQTALNLSPTASMEDMRTALSNSPLEYVDMMQILPETRHARLKGLATGYATPTALDTHIKHARENPIKNEDVEEDGPRTGRMIPESEASPVPPPFIPYSPPAPVTPLVLNIANPTFATTTLSSSISSPNLAESEALRIPRLEAMTRNAAEATESMLSRHGSAGLAIGALALGAMALMRPNLGQDPQPQDGKSSPQLQGGISMHRILEFPMDMMHKAIEFGEKLDIKIRGTVHKGSDHTTIANAVHSTMSMLAERTLGISIDHDDQRATGGREWARGLQKKTH